MERLPNSVRLANELLALANSLSEKLYATQETIDMADKLDIKDLVSEMREHTKDLVLSTVKDADKIDTITESYLDY